MQAPRDLCICIANPQLHLSASSLPASHSAALSSRGTGSRRLPRRTSTCSSGSQRPKPRPCRITAQRHARPIGPWCGAMQMRPPTATASSRCSLPSRAPQAARRSSPSKTPRARRARASARPSARTPSSPRHARTTGSGGSSPRARRCVAPPLPPAAAAARDNPCSTLPPSHPPKERRRSEAMTARAGGRASPRGGPRSRGARGPGKSGGHVEGDPATRLDQDGEEVALRVAVDAALARGCSCVQRRLLLHPRRYLFSV